MPAESGIHAGTPSAVVQIAVALVELSVARRWLPPFGAASGMLPVGDRASLMLRKLQALSERFFGRTEPVRTVPIPKYRRPAILVSSDRAAAYYGFLEDAVTLLKAKYAVKGCRRVKGRLESFQRTHRPNNLTLLHAYKICLHHQSCFWLSFAFQEQVREGRGLFETETIRQAVIVDVPFDAGNVLIRPETLCDKIGEFFCPAEIDFNDETLFSRQYFVVADDEVKVREDMPRSFMRLLSSEAGLFVRCLPRSILVSYDRVVRSEDTPKLVKFAFAAAECR